MRRKDPLGGLISRPAFRDVVNDADTLMEARRRHRSSLAELPANLAIKIAGCLTASSKWPMDDLRALRATCHHMLRVCGEPKVDRRVRFADDMSWDDPVGFATLIGHLTKVGNPEACFLTGANDGTVSDDAARRYIRQVEGKEKVVAAAAVERGDGRPEFRNDGCLRWREEAKERIW
ncbi:hypothetical protein C2845_PM05G22080 [Panicum miliaceum]|uniref:Uncharacterized protein n=1 Tax=Panicum miliaceum TaxID=4540 RepID=A0A3L6SUG6_PANMI|nr:hypothetical protein C2845_PM05G22080 [Panicum miliaceum]